MNIIYAQEDLSSIVDKKSVFLAGPTPRSSEVEGWRQSAINLFSLSNFDGVLLIPEEENSSSFDFEFDTQIEWENEALEKADVILFWIDRNLSTMPGFTTNIEFGYWLGKDSSKLIIGSPAEAPKMKYILYQASENGIPHYQKLDELVFNTIKKIDLLGS